MSNLKTLIGHKIFKTNDDGSLSIYRIIRCNEKDNSVFVSGDSGAKKYIKKEDLKQYKILEPDGVLSLSIVSLKDSDGKVVKDVIVTCAKYLEMKIGVLRPYAICRQNITDIFANLICTTSDNDVVGLSCNRDDCPTNFDMGMMLISDEVLKYEFVNFYRNDTLEDIFKFVDTREYDMVLTGLYTTHCKYSDDPSAAFKKKDKGWCKDLKTLLQDNNFQADINQMLGITDIAFDLSEYIYEKPLPDPDKGNYYTLPEDLKIWLAGTFKVSINDLTVIEYDYDINLADFNNANYFFLRDTTKTLYMIVYTTAGKYHLSDLEDMYNKKDFTTKWRIDFYNKYNNKNNVTSY